MIWVLSFHQSFQKRLYVSSHAKLSDGIIVMHNVVINAGAQIGINCIINTKSIVEHDVKLTTVTFATGSIVNGDAEVEMKPLSVVVQ